MYYVIIGYDAPDSADTRPLHREAHLERLRSLEQEGRLVIAGPFTDKSGSLMIIDAECEEDAQTFARTDPYTMHGIFTRVDVRPFKKVLPEN